MCYMSVWELFKIDEMGMNVKLRPTIHKGTTILQVWTIQTIKMLIVTPRMKK